MHNVAPFASAGDLWYTEGNIHFLMHMPISPIETPSEAPQEMPVLSSLLHEVREWHAVENPTPDVLRTQRLHRLLSELQEQRERVQEYTVEQARLLREEVATMLREMHARNWVNMGAYDELVGVYNALNMRVEDRGPVVETADQAVRFAQTGAVFSVGTQVLTPILGAIGGPIIGTAAGAGVLWLPEKIGQWAERAGANRRLVTTLTRLGLLGGAIALAPSLALPAAIAGGVFGGVYYLLNRFTAEDARQVRPAVEAARA